EKQLETAVADDVLLHIDLQALAGPLQVGKARFAHQPQGDDATGHAHLALLGLQFPARGLTVFIHKRGGSISPAEFPRIRIKTQFLDLLKFLLALFKLVARLKLQRESLHQRWGLPRFWVATPWPLDSMK